MYSKGVFYFFAFMIVLCSCQPKPLLSKVFELNGTWKVETKESYEVWKVISKALLEGKSYKKVDGKEMVTETLSIQEREGELYYQATVPNQNNGETISFILNKANKELLSFENLKHDFPKKIQYKFINKNKILVSVLGNDDEGFSYHLIKQTSGD